jgi:plasmid stabilization system protein ParE
VARTVRWSEAATRDLAEAAEFIARDFRYYAAALANPKGCCRVCS